MASVKARRSRPRAVAPSSASRSTRRIGAKSRCAGSLRTAGNPQKSWAERASLKALRPLWRVRLETVGLAIPSGNLDRACTPASAITEMANSTDPFRGASKTLLSSRWLISVRDAIAPRTPVRRDARVHTDPLVTTTAAAAGLDTGGFWRSLVRTNQNKPRGSPLVSRPARLLDRLCRVSEPAFAALRQTMPAGSSPSASWSTLKRQASRSMRLARSLGGSPHAAAPDARRVGAFSRFSSALIRDGSGRPRGSDQRFGRSSPDHRRIRRDLATDLAMLRAPRCAR